LQISGKGFDQDLRLGNNIRGGNAAMLEISAERWVAILTVTSILAAAGFGMLGLFSDYKQDGKVTWAGRIAAGGIALSAMLSILLGVAQDHVDAAKDNARRSEADRERAEQKARFDAQAKAFAGLTGQMGASLDTQALQLAELKRQNAMQQGLVTRTTALLRTTTQLGRQQEGNTLRVLQRMWNDSTWVSADSLSANVSALCGARPGKRPPAILPADALVKLTVSEKGQPESDEIELTAMDVHRINPDSPLVSIQLATLGSFLPAERKAAEALGPIESWKHRTARIEILGYRPGLVAAIAEAGGLPIPEAKPLADYPHLVNEGEGPGRALVTDSCLMWITLSIHARIVATGSGKIFEVLPYDGGDQGIIPGYVSIYFPKLDIDPEALPRFAK
jgi:hypothetical protein